MRVGPNSIRFLSLVDDHLESRYRIGFRTVASSIEDFDRYPEGNPFRFRSKQTFPWDTLVADLLNGNVASTIPSSSRLIGNLSLVEMVQ